MFFWGGWGAGEMERACHVNGNSKLQKNRKLNQTRILCSIVVKIMYLFVLGLGGARLSLK